MILHMLVEEILYPVSAELAEAADGTDADARVAIAERFTKWVEAERVPDSPQGFCSFGADIGFLVGHLIDKRGNGVF